MSTKWPSIAGAAPLAGPARGGRPPRPGRRAHRGAGEVRAAAGALPSLEVPVRRGGAALSGREDVGVHAQAHGAPGAPPFEAGLLEDPVEPLLLRLALH